MVTVLNTLCIFAAEFKNNNMKYEFNTTRFAELMIERKLNKTNASRMLGRKNSSTVQNWMDGEKIDSSHLVEICNTFNVSPTEFFLCDGAPIILHEKSEIAPNVNNVAIMDMQQTLLQQQLEFITERATLEKQQIQAIADLEKQHIRELMQKDIDLAKKEVRLREEIRREIKAEYENEMTR